MTKTCSKCKETKPVDEFHKSKQNKDGYRGSCKPCMNSSSRAYHHANRDELNAKGREYWAETREDRAAQRVIYRAENRQQIAEANRSYYIERRPQIIARTAEYRAMNPHVNWEGHYREKTRSLGLTATVESFTLDELTARYGNACFHCGGEFQELDHYPTPVSRGGGHTIENCKPSCTPCNEQSWRAEFRAETMSV